MLNELTEQIMKMNKGKALRIVEIAQTLSFQKTHKNNIMEEEGITYFSSTWAMSIDPNYKTSGRFEPFMEIIDNNFSTSRRMAKMCKVKDYTYEVVEAARSLPKGYFVDARLKKLAMKKLNKNYSVTPLREDLSDVIEAARNNPSKFGLTGLDVVYLDLMNLFIDENNTLFSHFRIMGERKTYYTPSLQQCSRRLRDFLLKNTGYCDVDAKSSFNCDFSMLLVKYGFEALEYKEYFILQDFFGEHSRKNLVSKGITKQEHLALMFGSTEARGKINTNWGEGKFEELTAAREKFTKILAQQQEFQNLQGFDKHHSEWHYPDFGKALSRMLNRIETKKMEAFSAQLELMGYETLTWCYDGLIVDKEIKHNDLIEINEWFEDLYWRSPLTIKKVW